MRKKSEFFGLACYPCKIPIFHVNHRPCGNELANFDIVCLPQCSLLTSMYSVKLYVLGSMYSAYFPLFSMYIELFAYLKVCGFDGPAYFEVFCLLWSILLTSKYSADFEVVYLPQSILLTSRYSAYLEVFCLPRSPRSSRVRPVRPCCWRHPSSWMIQALPLPRPPWRK